MEWHKLKIAKNWIWLSFSLSVFIFPLFPALGALSLVAIMLKIWQSNFQVIIISHLNQALAIIASLLIFSSILAQYSTDAWLGLANFLPFFALFIAFRYLITTLDRLKQLSWLLILPSLPIVILGLGQIYAHWNSPALISNILGWGLVAGGIPPGRMSSVFIYTNFLAIYLAIAFTLTAGLLLETWQSETQKSSRKLKTIILLSIILIADISGLILTSSRNAWGLAVFSFVAYALYLGWRWLVWGMFGAASVVFWASFVPNFGGTQLRQVVPAFIWQRLSDQIYERPVETLRLTQWQFCWSLIKERPWFGWGLRNFTPLYEAKTNYWFGHPHSLFLMLGAETGIMATGLLIVVIGLIMVQAVVLLENWSAKDSKLIFFSYAIAFTNLILFNLADVTIFDLRINTIAWIILAAISGITTKQAANMAAIADEMV